MTKGPEILRNTLDALAASAEERWGFTYCECAQCEFSLVVATADLAGGRLKVACPLCWKDSLHMVAMTTRPAVPGDRPEGPDARVRPMPNFTCASCGRQCLSPRRSEQDAIDEFESLYGVPFDATKHKQICDDCFKVRRYDE